MRQIDDGIAWRRIAGLRDVLAHAHFGIDDDISVERGRGGTPGVAAEIDLAALSAVNIGSWLSSTDN